jgi:hypothetical protein
MAVTLRYPAALRTCPAILGRAFPAGVLTLSQNTKGSPLTRRYYAAVFPPIARNVGRYKVQNLTKELQMNNRNQTQTNRQQALAPTPAPATASTHMNVFTVEEYEANGKTNKRWTKIGAAFPHKDGQGFSIELSAFPVDGRLVVLPPDPTDDRSK